MKSVLPLAILVIVSVIGIVVMPTDWRKLVFTAKNIALALLGVAILIVVFMLAALQSGMTIQLF